ncbi:MAG: hypothetical protein QOD90_5440 [Mycobacterium sp.]|nr:hypothetical protein [Mycobacterium sp.]
MDGEADDRSDAPVTVDLLADLQAGLLDDRTAARLRQRARTEPIIADQLAALDRVRREVAELGSDQASASDVPTELAARIGSALRSEAPLATTPRASTLRPRHIAAAAGVAAVIAAGAVGTAMLLGSGSAGDARTSGPSVAAPAGLPLSASQLDELLSQPPDLGELADPQRRVSCLSGLGYPTSTSVLGAKPLTVNGRPGLLLLLPGDVPGRIDAIVVGPNCSSVDTGLVVSSVVNRP